MKKVRRRGTNTITMFKPRKFRYRSEVGGRDKAIFWITLLIGIALAALIIFVW
jgi:hypothetical protein